MVVECPICSKVLNNEEICPYCGTNINEDIPVDFSSFQKLKNLFSSVFGNDSPKKDLDKFLLDNESKIANFIKDYQKPFEKLVLDISAIKQDNKSIYEEISRITTYFEEKKFNLSINQIKLCYTFKRIYEELDDIIAKKNEEYCVKTCDDIKKDMEKLNDFLSPKDYISKDKLSYKDQFKSSYDLIKPIKEYVDDNSDILSKDQKESISSFISNYDDFDKKIDELNDIYTLNQNLNSIINAYSKISKSNNLEKLQKEKTEYVELYNLAIELLVNKNSVPFLKDMIEDNRDNLNNFKSAYESLDDKIELLKIENYLDENRNVFVKFNDLKTSKITTHIDADVIRNEYMEFYDNCLKFDLDLLDASDEELVNDFKSNYEDIDNIVKYVNNRFDISKFLDPISNFVLGNSVDVLEKQKTDFKDLFEDCDSFISRLGNDLLES